MVGVFGDSGRPPDRATKHSGDAGRPPDRATEHSGDGGRPPAGVSDPVSRLEAWRRRGRSLRLKLIVEAPAPTGRAFSPTRTNTKDYAQRIQPLSVEECPLRAVFFSGGLL